ncbi:MAG: diaminopimelate epimerase, partial [Planctomycetota bacterium]|nr:diaminopimelate epimerase [Planctomycetota bacterium]
ASVRGDGTLRLRTWERGSGVTKACGTGACAVAAAYLNQEVSGSNTVKLELDGGYLDITRRGDELWMTGPARCVYSGVVPD